MYGSDIGKLQVLIHFANLRLEHLCRDQNVC